MKIKSLSASQIFDSKGDPTLGVTVVLENGTAASAAVPAGASTGKFEAVDLRDNDPQQFNGKGVAKAIANVNQKIASLLVGKEVEDQVVIDRLMIEADGTLNKANLGGNAMVGVSMAVCRAAAKALGLALYQYLGRLNGNLEFQLPQPLILVLEGGEHGNWATDIQEYTVIPQKTAFKNFQEMLKAGKKVFFQLGELLKAKDYDVKLGFEGGYCPSQITSNEEAFQLIIKAVAKAGFQLPKDFVLGIDAAASEFFQNGRYILKSEESKSLSGPEWKEKLAGWLNHYPLWLIEDGFSQEEWDSWVEFMSQLGSQHEIVGDDLLVTNVARIKKAIELKAVNAVIIKLNQVGTVTETLAAIKLAQSTGWSTVVSHRGGETRDDFIADLCVGAGCPQCKFGGPTKPERVAKYNRIIEIEKKLSVIGQ